MLQASFSYQLVLTVYLIWSVKRFNIDFRLRRQRPTVLLILEANVGLSDNHLPSHTDLLADNVWLQVISSLGLFHSGLFILRWRVSLNCNKCRIYWHVASLLCITILSECFVCYSMTLDLDSGITSCYRLQAGYTGLNLFLHNVLNILRRRDQRSARLWFDNLR